MDQKTTLENRIAALEQMMIDGFGKVLQSMQAFGGRQSREATAASLAHTSRIYPKTRSAVFIGRGYFGDNIKYAFLAFAAQAKANGIAYHFITEDAAQHRMLSDAGLPCLSPDTDTWTTADIRVLLEAQVAVLSDGFFPRNWRNPAIHALLQGARTIQLWHGIPIKGIGLQNITPGLLREGEDAAEIMASCGPFDLFVGNAAASHSMWARHFAFDDYAAIGSPRNDIFFRDLTQHDLLNTDRAALNEIVAHRAAGRTVILYAPTFREQPDACWLHRAAIGQIAGHCQSQGYSFFVNLHPAEHGALDTMRENYPGVRFLAPQSDIFPILKNVDALVTDYSSLMFDYLLLDRPLIFYRPDHAAYIAAARGMVAEHVDCTPGRIAVTPAQLNGAIDMAVRWIGSGGDPHRIERDAVRRRFYDQRDGRAGERLAALILEDMKIGKKRQAA